MKFINAVKTMIDFMAILIQIPYFCIAGFIVCALKKDHDPSYNVYVWFPMAGFAVLWVDWLGRADYRLIYYKDILRKH